MENLVPPQPPLPPNLSYPGVMAIDITAKFAAAVKQLAPGELIKDDHFTLFESVSALEIGDPKMDSGFLNEGETLEDDYDVLRELLPEEVLGIIDQLLCLEMAWHLGYPLSQTLLTNVYVEAIMNPHPQHIWEADFTRDPAVRDRQPRMLSILRAYCLGMLKACCFVNKTVFNELYYEEEDFVTNTYDRRLLEDIDEDRINDLLMAARADLKSYSDIDSKISMALDLRLELRIAFLRAIDLMDKREANPESLKMPWIQMKGLVEHFSKQHELAKPVPEAFSTKLQRRLASTMPPRPIIQPSFTETFDHFKRMFQDGLDIIDVLKYSDTQSLMNFVLTFQTRKPQPHTYIRCLLQYLLFNEMRVLGSYSIRQIIDHDLMIVVLPNGRQLDRAFDDIELPSDPRHQIAAQMEDFRKSVAERFFDIMRHFCQNRCRARRMLCHSIQEWDMLQVDMEDMDSLLQIALEDEPLVMESGRVLHSLPLSSWCFFYKIRQMEWIVQLGFELDIYQSDELAGMYWYLNYLAKERQHHVERIRTFVDRSFFAAGGAKDFKRGQHSSSNATAASGSSALDHGYEIKHGSLSPIKFREYSRSMDWLRVTTLDAACTWEFADGLCCLYSVLSRLKILPQPGFSSTRPSSSSTKQKNPSSSAAPPPPPPPPQQQQQDRPYSTGLHRYEIRMKPFTTIGHPRLPSFAEFQRATTQPDTDLAAMLHYAETAISGARKGFEALSRMSDAQSFSVGCHDRWVANAKACLKATIAAGVAINVLKKTLATTTAATTAAAASAASAAVVNEGGKLENSSPGTGTGIVDVDGKSLPDLSGVLRVEIPKPGQSGGYHDWWIVPQLFHINV
ncbi:Mak10 subunit, NatC N-terminal acetyltransferase-domain-containing protein [Microdochium trichocladiopsis]|uniref:Mak10 subunit, NatC N-terminal acetyltransferase-domain-containing protein n=1 Tax=Microdochium trichocladiopsis TaxID=1682393 RepID=A0A9P9BVB7_9PEZI|nr:Mak10 subunit, NatC N-terminal acetyltransferase-domain-containing protein [Microdochium trichocladiopsis]KAH7040078.1 Mak10 subunit, NatC N-terminal acetyltransferase-domain-containing protein [Microdochium trichocladiopsis]